MYRSANGERFECVGIEALRGRTVDEVRRSYNPGKARRIVVRATDLPEARRYRAGWETADAEPLAGLRGDEDPAWACGFAARRECDAIRTREGFGVGAYFRALVKPRG